VSDAWKCNECYVIVENNQILQALNPFNGDLTCYGCPECFAIDSFQKVCDEPGCNQTASCGTNAKAGYRQTCGQHFPKELP
jgi:hypothetical protein